MLWSPYTNPEIEGQRSSSEIYDDCSSRAPVVCAVIETNPEMLKGDRMAKKLSRSTIRGLMADWGRKGGSRATEKQKNAALACIIHEGLSGSRCAVKTGS